MFRLFQFQANKTTDAHQEKLSHRQNESIFRARSAVRDNETDKRRLSPISRSIDVAIASAQSEKEGLERRVHDMLDRAALATGYGYDEHLARDRQDEADLTVFDKEIANGETRIQNLVVSISHLEFLRTSFNERFPTFAPAIPPENQDE